VRDQLQLEPLHGHIFIFSNAERNRLKLRLQAAERPAYAGLATRTNRKPRTNVKIQTNLEFKRTIPYCNGCSAPFRGGDKQRWQGFGDYEMPIDRLLRYIFRKYYRERLTEMVAPNFPILLDYPVRCAHRYGYGKPPHPQLFAMLDAERNEYARRLSGFCSLIDWLKRIPDEAAPNALEPCWGPQRFFSSLDAVALYGMLFEFRPKRFVEIGSGYSTKFAGRSIQDHSLSTRITSIDPAPRTEIDKLCDSLIRRPLEELDLNIFGELDPGDFLFIDSSHRTFQNSDVTVVFMDVLPRLKPGVVLHFHDIFWPYDYLPEWADRFYSEQYLLGSYLLGSGASNVKVLLPNAFVVRDRELAETCKPLLEIAGIRRPCNAVTSPYGISGGSFWLRIGPRASS
jgi:hypothetical protein